MEHIKYAWSRSGDIFYGSHDSIEDAIHEAIDEEALEVGDGIDVGEIVNHTAHDFVNADNIVENISECAYENMPEDFEWLNDFPKAKIKELKQIIGDFIQKECPPGFFSMKNVKEYVVTEEHMKEHL